MEMFAGGLHETFDATMKAANLWKSLCIPPIFFSQWVDTNTQMVNNNAQKKNALQNFA